MFRKRPQPKSPKNMQNTTKSSVRKNHKDSQNTLYGIMLSNYSQEPSPQCQDASYPSTKKKSKRSTTLSKNTYKEEPYVNPGAPTPPTFSSLKRKMESSIQYKIIDQLTNGQSTTKTSLHSSHK